MAASSVTAPSLSLLSTNRSKTRSLSGILAKARATEYLTGTRGRFSQARHTDLYLFNVSNGISVSLAKFLRFSSPYLVSTLDANLPNFNWEAST